MSLKLDLTLREVRLLASTFIYLEKCGHQLNTEENYLLERLIQLEKDQEQIRTEDLPTAQESESKVSI